MADDITVEINGVGLVLFERSKRAKRLNISVKPFRGVRVAVPYASSLKKAEEFVHTKAAWLKKQLEKIKQHERKYNYNSTSAGYVDKVKAKATLVKRLEWVEIKRFLFYVDIQ